MANQPTYHHCECGRSIPLRFDQCRDCEAGTPPTALSPRQVVAEARPTFDGDTRRLVARCAARGVPVGVVDSDGFLTAVRTLDELEAARLGLRITTTTDTRQKEAS